MRMFSPLHIPRKNAPLCSTQSISVNPDWLAGRDRCRQAGCGTWHSLSSVARVLSWLGSRSTPFAALFGNDSPPLKTSRQFPRYSLRVGTPWQPVKAPKWRSNMQRPCGKAWGFWWHEEQDGFKANHTTRTPKKGNTGMLPSKLSWSSHNYNL